MMIILSMSYLASSLIYGPHLIKAYCLLTIPTLIFLLFQQSISHYTLLLLRLKFDFYILIIVW